MLNFVDGIPVFGQPDPGALSQIKTCLKTADLVTLMADNHKGYAVPIGGVVAYKDSISPSGVGFDIACGNKAVLLDIPGSEIQNNIGKIMDDVFSTISFGVGQRNLERVDHSLFESSAWKVEAVRPHKQMAQSRRMMAKRSGSSVRVRHLRSLARKDSLVGRWEKRP
jgi:tRNA-splicing ligase RtcB